jgi:phage-related minor tail protein
MGQDMQSSAVQVGKALNDPVKGITALSRVGVSFTAQQKDQITALVKSGDTMGAQKIILHELNKEFGNAAKSAGEGFGGSMARLQDIIGDTFRSIGLWLLPILTKLADWLTGTAVPADHRLRSADRPDAGRSSGERWATDPDVSLTGS